MESGLGRRYAVFAMGLFCISMAVGFITKASLGTSPITSIPYSLALVFPQYTLGNFTIAFSLLLVTLQYILTDKSKMDRTAKINILLEVVVSFAFGYLIDLSMMLFSGFVPTDYIVQVASVLVGIVILAFGVYLQIVADVVMVPGDGFAYALTLRVKRNYGKVRVTSDTTMVIIAAVIGIVGLGTLGGVREGTVMCCILTGMVARWYMRHFSALTSKLVPGKNLDSISREGSANGHRCPRTRPQDPSHREGDQEDQGQERIVPGNNIQSDRCPVLHRRPPRLQRQGPDRRDGRVPSGRMRHRRQAR